MDIAKQMQIPSERIAGSSKPEEEEQTAGQTLKRTACKVSERSERQARRWQERFDRHRMLEREIEEAAPDILRSENFESTKAHIQHGSMTVNSHCRNVARYSLAMSRKLHIRCSSRELIRGALLHDYFLYDWHIDDYRKPHKLHGFYHPGRALANASREYDLTEREKEIIKKHMWPLTVVPPTCREAWIVTCADKWCSLMETFHIHKGHGAIIEQLKKKEPEE